MTFPLGRNSLLRVKVRNVPEDQPCTSALPIAEPEDVIVSGNRATVLWVYRKVRDGKPWHLRGVDVFTVRDGKVAAKLAYVKG